VREVLERKGNPPVPLKGRLRSGRLFFYKHALVKSFSALVLEEEKFL
jgi:hypothetical protein